MANRATPGCLDSPKRVAAGVSAGGEFAAHNRPDANVLLDRPGHAELYRAVPVRPPLFDESLPAWPAHVPQPEISLLSWDDDYTFSVYATMGEGRDFVSVSEWSQQGDEHDSITSGDELTPYDDDTNEAILAYLHTVRQRVTAVDSMIISAARGAYASEVLDIVQSRCEQPAIATPLPTAAHEDPIVTARVRAHQMLAAHGYIDQGEEPKEAMQQAIADAIANLRHLGEEHGLEFDEIEDKAVRYYDAEISEASFNVDTF